MRMTRSAMTPCASQLSLAAWTDSAHQSFHICIGFDICFFLKEARPCKLGFQDNGCIDVFVPAAAAQAGRDVSRQGARREYAARTRCPACAGGSANPPSPATTVLSPGACLVACLI